METSGETLRKNPLKNGIIVGFGGAALCTIGTVIFLVRATQILGGAPAIGKVVGRAPVSSTTRKRVPTYAPVVEFSTPGHVSYQFTSSMGGGAQPVVGETVNVRYDPANPRHAEIDSLTVVWLPVFACFILSLFGVILGIGTVRAMKRREAAAT